METVIIYLARFLVLLFILPAHEFAHAYAAHKNGDDTAKLYGRYTLNPFKHFDALGIICFLIVGFGWAKPVPVNPYNYKDYKKGCFWVSVAGILTNYALAFLFYPLLLLANYYIYPYLYNSGLDLLGKFIFYLFLYGFILDLSFFSFNLIPVYPLDGYRLLDTFVKKKDKLSVYKKYGYYVLLGLILLSSVANRIPELKFLNVFGYFMEFAVKIVGYPISWLWDTIFKTTLRFDLWKIIA